MFEQMLGLVKGQVSKSLSGIEGIPAGKESAVVETTTSSLMSGLKKFATPDKLSGLLGMVGGGGGGAKNTGVNTIGTGVVSALTSKVGLNPAVAAFYRRYLESFGMLPSLFSYRGYDVAKLFITAIHDGDGDGGNGRSINRADVSLLQVPYHFRQDVFGKWVNDQWVLVRYRNDYLIEVR